MKVIGHEECKSGFINWIDDKNLNSHNMLSREHI